MSARVTDVYGQVGLVKNLKTFMTSVFLTLMPYRVVRQKMPCTEWSLKQICHGHKWLDFLESKNQIINYWQLSVVLILSKLLFVSTGYAYQLYIILNECYLDYREAERTDTMGQTLLF